MKKFSKNTLVFFFIGFVLVAPFLVNAQQPVNLNYTPLAPIPETLTAGKVTSLGTYLRGIYITGVALAGLFAVFSIVRGGFQILFTDSILGHMEGKGIILRAVGGLIIVFSSFVLMNMISPSLAQNLDLNLDFIRRDIKPFQSKITPVTQEQLADLQRKDAENRENLKQTRLNLARATTEESRNKDKQAKELRTQADSLQAEAADPILTPEEKNALMTLAEEFNKQAQTLEINSILSHTAALASNYYTKGILAARDSENLAGSDKVQIQNFETATKSLADLTNWYSRNISNLERSYGDDPDALLSATALYEKKISDSSKLLKSLALAKINSSPEVYVQTTGITTTALQRMDNDAAEAIQRLNTYKSTPKLSQEEKTSIDNTITKITSNANEMITAAKLACRNANLPCKDWVSPTQ